MLKFTTNQNELEHLINLIFKNHNHKKLTKIDLFKIFSLLLPHGGPASSLLSSGYNIDYNNKENNENNNNNEMNKSSSLMMQANSGSQFAINPQKRKLENTQNINNKEQDSSNISNNNLINNNNIINNFKNLKDILL